MDNYYSIFFFILSFVLIESKISSFKVLKIIVLSILTIFLSIRYQVGNDYAEYLNVFTGIKLYHDNSYVEPLYLIICKLSPSFTYVIAIISIISMYLLYKCIEFYRPKYFYSSLLIYYGVYFILIDIHLIRQGIALLIVFYSYKFLWQKEIKKFVTLVIIAMGFHISAFIAFILLILPKVKFTKSRRLYFVFFGIFFYIILVLGKTYFFDLLSHISFLERYAVVYNNAEYSHSYGISLGLLFDILLFFILNASKVKGLDEFLLNIFTCSIIIFIVFNDFAVVLRLGYYFRIVNILLIINLLKYVRPKILFVVFISIYSYYYLETTLTTGNAVLEYRTILDNDVKIQTF